MNTAEKILLDKLLRRYLNGLLNEEEAVQMHQLLQYEEARESLAGMFEEDIKLEGEAVTDVNWNGLWQNISSRISSPENLSPPVHPVRFLHKWQWAAASVLLIITAAALFWFLSDRSSKTDSALALTSEILPGKEGAVLTLSDGSQISLDSMQNALIALQGGVTAKVVNGVLQYEGSVGSGSEVVYNTMSTPKGRQFQVTLPDGTKVWLNSASSLRYPTVFAGKERRVEIKGEAYFEVAKNNKMPFRLRVNDKADVLVLGTQFNVNAYENEKAIKTTLIDGSVKVGVTGAGGAPVPSARQEFVDDVILKPGQQAVVEAGRKTQAGIEVVKADVDKVLAWKNGLFNFEGATLQEVMRQLERWYNIEVEVDPSVPYVRFAGKMKKNIALKDLLDVFDQMEIHFRLEDGRKLIVLP